MPVTMPSAGVVATSSSSLRRALWAATASPPYSTRLPSSSRSARLSLAVRCPRACRVATASGRAASSRRACRSRRRVRSARSVSRSGPSSTAAASSPTDEGSSRTSRSPAAVVAPGRDRTSVTVPETGAVTTCSIFIASTTRRGVPRATSSPAPTRTSRTVPVISPHTSPGAASSADAPASTVVSTPEDSIHPVVTCQPARSSWASSSRSRGRVVSTPSIEHSSAARRALSSAPARPPWLWVTTLATRESKAPSTREPSTRWVSTRTPGPLGQVRPVATPCAGRSAPSEPTRSAATRSSTADPRTAGGSARPRSPRVRPVASASWVRTRSTPVTSSVTGCSTCRRGLTSMKNQRVGSSASRRNSTVASPRYPRPTSSRTAASCRAARTSSGRSGAGATSTTFWKRRWRVQSRSPRWVTPPSPSAATCTSTWRARST